MGLREFLAVFGWLFEVPLSWIGIDLRPPPDEPARLGGDRPYEREIRGENLRRDRAQRLGPSDLTAEMSERSEPRIVPTPPVTGLWADDPSEDSVPEVHDEIVIGADLEAPVAPIDEPDPAPEPEPEPYEVDPIDDADEEAEAETLWVEDSLVAPAAVAPTADEAAPGPEPEDDAEDVAETLWEEDSLVGGAMEPPPAPVPSSLPNAPETPEPAPPRETFEMIQSLDPEASEDAEPVVHSFVFSEPAPESLPDDDGALVPVAESAEPIDPALEQVVREARVHAEVALRLAAHAASTERSLAGLLGDDTSLTPAVLPALKRLRFASGWVERAASRAAAAASRAQGCDTAEEVLAAVEDARQGLDDASAAFKRVGKEDRRARRALPAEVPREL